MASGAETKRFESHVYGITLAYSPDGKTLASGGVDEGKDVYSLRLWDPATGKEIRRCTLPKNEPPTYLAFHPKDGTRLAAVVAEDNMHVFDTTTGKEIIPVKHYWPSRVIYARDGKTLVSVGNGPVIRLWDAATGEEKFQDRDGHKAGVTSVAVSPDQKLVATGGEDVRLWDRAAGKMVHKIEVKGGAAVVAFAPDGKTLAAAGRDKVVHLWDVESGQAKGELKGHKLMLVGLAYSPDGKYVAAGDTQAAIRIWEVASGKELHLIDNKSGTESLALAFAPDGKTLAAAGAWNDSSFLPKPGSVIKINGKEVKIDGDFNIQGVNMSRKEGYFVMQWDVESGKEVRKFAGLTDKIKGLAFSPDGKTLAASSRDGKVCLWDAAIGEEKLHIVAHPQHKDAGFAAAPCLAFSPDGKTLATAGTDHTVRFWDATTAREKGQLQADAAVYSLAFLKDGKALVTGGPDTAALLWDLTLPAKKANGQPNVILIQ